MALWLLNYSLPFSGFPGFLLKTLFFVVKLSLFKGF